MTYLAGCGDAGGCSHGSLLCGAGVGVAAVAELVEQQGVVLVLYLRGGVGGVRVGGGRPRLQQEAHGRAGRVLGGRRRALRLPHNRHAVRRRVHVRRP